MFRRVKEDEKVYGTSVKGYVLVAPVDLVRVFGEPDKFDQYKVSGMYTFHDKDGNEYNLYDEKATTLYDSEGLRPSELWQKTEPFEFDVGSNTSVNKTQKFIKFVEESV